MSELVAKAVDEKYCESCGSLIKIRAELCPKCGVRQRPHTTKSRTTAGLLAFFLGGLGAHKFYLGRNGMGLLYLAISWTFIPAILSIFEAFGFFLSSDDSFAAKVSQSEHGVPLKKVLLVCGGVLFALVVLGKLVEKPKPANSELPKRTVDESLDCSGRGYTSIFKPQTQYAPAMVWVTFRGKQPSRTAAAEAVSGCLKRAKSVKQFKGDLMGQAWWSKTGNNDDDSVQELANGSSSLIIREGTTDIVPLDIGK